MTAKRRRSVAIANHLVALRTAQLESAKHRNRLLESRIRILKTRIQALKEKHAPAKD